MTRFVGCGGRFGSQIGLAPGQLESGLKRMKEGGRPVQFVAVPAAGDLKALAAIARQYGATLSVSGGDPEAIGKATGGRVNYRVASAEEIVPVAEHLTA